MFGLLWICSKTLLILFWRMFWIAQSLKGHISTVAIDLLAVVDYMQKVSPRCLSQTTTLPFSMPTAISPVFRETAEAVIRDVNGHTTSGLNSVSGKKRCIRWLTVDYLSYILVLSSFLLLVFCILFQYQFKLNVDFCQWKLNYIIYVSLQWKHWYSKFISF